MFSLANMLKMSHFPDKLVQKLLPRKIAEKRWLKFSFLAAIIVLGFGGAGALVYFAFSDGAKDGAQDYAAGKTTNGELELKADIADQEKRVQRRRAVLEKMDRKHEETAKFLKDITQKGRKSKKRAQSLSRWIEK